MNRVNANDEIILKGITARLKETGVAPTLEEMKSFIGARSKTTIHRTLKRLEAKGELHRMFRRRQAIALGTEEPFPGYPLRPLVDMTKGFRYFRVVKLDSEDNAKLFEWRPSNAEDKG